MIFSKRMMFLNILLLVLSAAVLWVSCANGTTDSPPGNTTPGLYDNDEPEPVSVTFTEGAGYQYPRNTINVDYNTANNAVFFDFSTGTKTVLTHDFFDLAIDASGIIIANSGSYGAGIQVYDTGEADIAGDYSSLEDKVKEYTFKPTLPVERLYGYQSELNPLGELGTETSNVRLIKVKYKTTDTAEYFKVTFGMTMTGGPPSFNITVVPGLGSGTANQVAIVAPVSGLTASYGWLYFKLVGTGGPRVLNTGTTWTGGGTAVPKAADWDILGTRTDELQTEDGTTVSTQMPVANRSSILLNIYGKVKAGVVSEKLIDAVSTGTVDLRAAVDTIGYGWYSMAGMPPTFSVAKNTYVIKTVEGVFAKFQPESFYGPNNESFVMDFSYYYGGSDPDPDPDPDPAYSQATLNVDYANANNAVFFDFSSRTVTELPHDFFDIAIDGSGNIIANSGSYGSGVTVYKTEGTDITADLTSLEASVKEYTFKTGTSLYNYQSAVNPFEGEIGSGGQMGNGSGKVYLIKTQGGAYYKVIFDIFGMVSMSPPTAGYKITVVKNLDGGESAKTVLEDTTSGIRNGFGYIYFDLDAAGGPKALNNGSTLKDGVTLNIPKAADWDILATRTNELQSNTDGTAVHPQMPMASRSSVLLNIYKEVQAKVVTGKSIAEITATDLSDEGLSGEIDTIGYGWYTTTGMPPTYSVPNNTYVIKTVEEKFAKFQPTTFAKDGKSFVMDFYYDYQE
jgi:hypothetical protein